MKKLMSLVLFCLILTSCSKGTTSTTGGAALKENLVVGMECNYPPYNFTVMSAENGAVKIYGSNGYAYGYDVMIADKIAKSMGKNLVIKQITWEGLIPALNSGSIDLIIAGMSETAERKKSVDFTGVYYETEFLILMKKDSPFKNAKTNEDFNGAKFVGQKDTSYDLAIDQLKGAVHGEPLSSIPLIINAINNGISDATIVEKSVGDSIISTNENLIMVSLEKDKGFEETDEIKTTVSIAVKKGNKELLDKVNEVLGGVSKEERDSLMKKSIDSRKDAK